MCPLTKSSGQESRRSRERVGPRVSGLPAARPEATGAKLAE